MEKETWDQDILGKWLAARLINAPGRMVTMRAAYEDLAAWLPVHGGLYAFGRRAWANAMIERGFRPARSTGGIRVLHGYLIGDVAPA